MYLHDVKESSLCFVRARLHLKIEAKRKKNQEEKKENKKCYEVSG